MTGTALRHNRPFVVLVVAHALTRLAFWMAFLGMMSLVSFTFGSSASGTAMVIATLGVPFIVLAPFAGTFVDRSNPKWTLASTYVAGGLLVLGLTSVTSLWQIVVGAAVWGITGTLILPSLGALLKRGLVPEDQLARANGVIRSVWEITLIAGPALSGLMVREIGPRAPFVAAALLYAAGLPVLLAMRSPARAPAGRDRAGLEELRKGIVLLFGRPDLRALAIWTGLAGAGISAMLAVEPVFVREVLGGGPERLGLIYSLAGVGATVGALGGGASRFAGRELAATAMGTALFGGCILFYGGVASWPAVIPAVTLLGTGLGLTITLTQVLLQRRSPPDVVGRVLAAQRGSESAFDLLGTFAAGGVAAALGVRATLVGGGAVVVAAGIALGVRARTVEADGAGIEEAPAERAAAELTPPPLALERFD
jgi:predicted MFS family arabinose efflux permease